MTDHEEGFAEALDALTRGEPPAPDDDLTRFVAEARSNWSNPAVTPFGSPPRLSAADLRQLWSAIQQEATITSSGPHEGSPNMSATSPTIPARAHQPNRWGATIARWQPVLSMAIMFAILAGLVGIAYTGLNRQDRGPEPTALAALQDNATPTAGMCAKPPAATEEEIRAFSYDDWPLPRYDAIGYAGEEITDRARQLIQGFWFCGGGDANADYLSTRGRHLFMYDELLPEQQAAIDVYLCLPREQDVLQDFPLTLNTQRVDPLWQGFPSSQWNSAPVYELSDGRYGMAMGRLTTDIIRDPSTALAQDSLWFVAFIEENGHLYIDETFLAFSGDPSNYSYGQMTGDCD